MDMNWTLESLAIVLSIIFGAALGWERQVHGKAAGLRTNILICLGATVFTILSRSMAGPNDALTRITAQIVSGVGFLGAGAIIQDRGGIHGLTTAATIWLVASIGASCGAGRFDLAAVTTLMALIVLLGLRHLEHRVNQTPKEPHDS